MISHFPSLAQNDCRDCLFVWSSHVFMFLVMSSDHEFVHKTPHQAAYVGEDEWDPEPGTVQLKKKKSKLVQICCSSLVWGAYRE